MWEDGGHKIPSLMMWRDTSHPYPGMREGK
jgi:hypothetical protein